MKLAAVLLGLCLEGGAEAAGAWPDVKIPSAFDCSDKPAWASFHRLVIAHAARGWPEPQSEDPEHHVLAATARGLVERWRPTVCSGDCRTSDLLEYRWVEELGARCRDSANFDRYVVTHFFRNRGLNWTERSPGEYCHFGFITALFVTAQFEFGSSVARAQRSLFLGFILLGDFYVFDWLESSGWPVNSLLLTLNLYLSTSRLLVNEDVETLVSPWPGEVGPAPLWAHLQWQGTSEAGKPMARFFDSPEPRPSLTIWQFCQHTSLAGEAKTMLTRFPEALGMDVHFLGNSIASSICGNYGLCASPEMITLIQGFLDRYKAGEGFEAVAAPFASALAPHLRAADVAMCSQPVFWCRFLLRLGKPVFLYGGLPVMWDVREEDKAAWADDFSSLLTGPEHVVLAYAPYYARILHWQFGVRVPAQPTLGLHTGVSYAPGLGDANSVLVSRFGISGAFSECVLQQFLETNTWFPLRFEQLEKILFENELARTSQEKFGGKTRWEAHTREIKTVGMPWHRLARHRAAIFFPYDFHIFLFNEVYSMNMPVFVPRDLWKWLLGLQTIPSMGFRRQWEKDPRVARIHGPGKVFDVPEISPFYTNVHRPMDVEAAYSWASCSDWALQPHVRYFRGVADLLSQLLDAEGLHVTSSHMKAFNEEAVVAAVANWRRVARRLLFAARAGRVRETGT